MKVKAKEEKLLSQLANLKKKQDNIINKYKSPYKNSSSERVQT